MGASVGAWAVLAFPSFIGGWTTSAAYGGTTASHSPCQSVMPSITVPYDASLLLKTSIALSPSTVQPPRFFNW